MSAHVNSKPHDQSCFVEVVQDLFKISATFPPQLQCEQKQQHLCEKQQTALTVWCDTDYVLNWKSSCVSI